ncbi:outer membrane protein [Lichenibacterium minor]|nr:porin family protein [Lichenibacterium minor]
MNIRIGIFAVGAAAAGFMGVGVGAAAAADLPARMAPVPYVAPVPVFTWTGAYFGVNAGASFDQNTPFHLYDGNGLTLANTSLGTIRPEHFHNSDSGFTAGGQVGYNYQFTGFGSGLFGPNSGFVVGAEADASYIDGGTSGTYTGLNAAGTTSATNTFRSGIDFLGTVRGRVGYGFDRLLVYGTGGFAYGDAFQSAALYTAGNPSLMRYFGSHSGIQTGYTYGGGVEYALPTASFLNVFHSSAVTIKAEYLRYDLGHANFAADGLTTTTAYAIRSKTEGDIARVGLNYKF